jgi:hypothetical protein
MTTPSTDWKEIVPPGEEAVLEKLAEQLRDVQRKRALEGKAMRGLHAKGHLGLRGTLTVNADVPKHAAHGLFAKPGAKYETIVRLSNGAGTRQHDRVGDVRGIAIKVLGVPGKKLIPGMEDATTQDFLLIGSATTPFRNANDFVALIIAAAGPQILLLPRFGSAVGFGRAFGLLRKLVAGLGVPFHSFAGQRLFSALPIRVGPYAAKVAILPAADVPPADPAAKLSLEDEMSARIAKTPLAWDLALQFFVDETRTPIEDSSAEWKESDSPWVKVARFELPVQDVSSAAGRALSERVEALSFDPWHALIEHRPLGQMMRARSAAYRLSTMERGAAPEPTGPSVD